MSISTRDQLYAFSLLILAVLCLGLAPVVVSGLMGKTLPDSLIAVSDKTVTGLVGVLGTVAAMIFRTNSTDQARAENTGAAFRAIEATAANTPQPVQPVVVTNKADDPVPTTPGDAT